MDTKSVQELQKVRKELKAAEDKYSDALNDFINSGSDDKTSVADAYHAKQKAYENERIVVRKIFTLT